VRIDGLGAPNVPYVPAAIAPAGASQSYNATANAAAQALQIEEQKGGGGGHGGGHGVKKMALDTIDDIAARASLNIEQRKKTMLDRMRDIEKMKAEMAADDEHVGEKDPDADDRQPKRDGSRDAEAGA
jgi:hypothetical protein